MYKVRTSVNSMTVLTWLLHNEIELESADVVVENGVRVAEEYRFENAGDALYFKLAFC
jgi:hypothetical protein